MKILPLRSALFLATAGLAVFAFAACGGGDDDNGSSATNTPQTKATATQPANGGGGGGSKNFEIDMTDNKYTPSEISVSVGDEVTFKVVNKGTAIHNMHILSQAAEGKDFSSDALVNPGSDSTFTAKFTKAGTYDFQCDYHLPDMAGKITVK